jgi:WD40 repeat protein
VQSLNIQKRLRKHRGCVNTISFSADGRLLLSGSDDRTLVLWDWQEAAPALSFHTGHSNNVYHALFMPVSGDRSIVSCAADGEVCICYYSFTWRCPCNSLQYTGWLLSQQVLTRSTAAAKIAPCGLYVVEFLCFFLSLLRFFIC